MSRPGRILLPVLVLTLGAVGAGLLIKFRPHATRAPSPAPPPLVRVVTAELGGMRLEVASQGTIQAGTTSRLVAEVSGKVVSVSAAFEVGEFVAAGDSLLRIEDRDYRLALATSRAQLAQARLALAQEAAQAEVARREWEELSDAEADPLVLREPQLASAEAGVAAAEARVAQAELNVERTVLLAPFAGRISQKLVDRGQFVAAGTPIATLIGIDHAELRLPVSDAELAFLDLDMTSSTRASDGAVVIARARVAGEPAEWRGRVVRTGAELDPRTRTLQLIARFDDPYGRSNGVAAGERAPLTAGRFVEVSILGRYVEDVIELPRSALRGRSQLLVIDEDDRLRFRDVELLRVTATRIILRSGVASGERVCVSALDVVSEGMKVRVAPDGPTLERGPELQ